jgi:hypothetical protein
LAIRWGGGTPRYGEREQYEWRERARFRESDSQLTPPWGKRVPFSVI